MIRTKINRDVLREATYSNLKVAIRNFHVAFGARIRDKDIDAIISKIIRDNENLRTIFEDWRKRKLYGKSN